MKSYHDATLLVHMNLPGTHDAATWNYSRSTQSSLHYISGLAKLHPSNAANYRCQTRSLADMLAAGIRVFDLRYAFDVTRTALVFWHGNALQSETATVDDVLFSFYAWLQSHPSEAIFLSFQHEGGKNDAETQWLLHAALQSPAARQFVSQDRGRLTTLGEARGQITLLRRFDLDQLDPSYERSMPGLHFPPSKWTVNGANISLTYNESTGETAYIQDYYNPVTPHGSNASMNIRWKLNATEAHMRRAATSNHGSLFWHFASSTKTSNDPPDTPVIQALGNGSLTPDGGVNQQLIGFMQEMRGKRLGITMFDFYDEPEELLSTYLSLLSPEQARDMSREVEHGSCIYCLM
jgi:1-phosphatidylinositol phosphodiesterase